MNTKINQDFQEIFPEYYNSDFIIGVDNYSDIEIDNALQNGLWYFKNTKKGLIKRFVLERTKQIEKICIVTLIKKDNGKFTPRFDFQIWNITKKALNDFSKVNINQNLIKAKVDLESCYQNFLSLINFIKGVSEIDFGTDSYSVIDTAKIEVFKNVTKKIAIDSFKEKYGSELTEQDITLLLDRRVTLTYFNDLLTNEEFFEKERLKLGTNKRIEDVWQHFFETNPWIFGYGLQLISCEKLDYKKLENTVVGNDIVNGSGKRIDALLKTKGNISKILFSEIKTHLPNLLVEPYDRPGVFVPAKELRGAVAQIQKTIHKVTLNLQQNYLRPVLENGNPTGEELLFVKPKGIAIIGKLDDFKTVEGINYEMLSSFEIYRQQISGVEIITYDELYERVRFIVEE